MKIVYTLAFLLLSISGSAQNGFAAIGGASFIKSGSGGFGGTFNVGAAVDKFVTIGPGIDVIKFKGDRNPYIPFYIHFKYYFSEKDIKPYVSIAPGYGFYKSALRVGNSDIVTKGGAYISAMIGLTGKDNKKKNSVGPFVQAGMKFAQFRTNSFGQVTKSNGTYLGVDFGIRF